MEDKAARAEALFRQGYNCAQAVLGAFAGEIGMRQQDAMRLASSFGGGMGKLREVCGAASAMFMVLGMRLGYSDPDDVAAKNAHYARINQAGRAFAQMHGSLLCRELLHLQSPEVDTTPSKRTEAYYQQRPCARIVRGAAAMTARYLEGEEK